MLQKAAAKSRSYTIALNGRQKFPNSENSLIVSAGWSKAHLVVSKRVASMGAL